MVRHNYWGMQFDLPSVLKQAVPQRNHSGCVRQQDAQYFESDKVCCMEFLYVRQVSSVVTLHRLHNAERKLN
jgi:hypothetical protein